MVCLSTFFIHLLIQQKTMTSWESWFKAELKLYTALCFHSPSTCSLCVALQHIPYLAVITAAAPLGYVSHQLCTSGSWLLLNLYQVWWRMLVNRHFNTFKFFSPLALALCWVALCCQKVNFSNPWSQIFAFTFAFAMYLTSTLTSFSDLADKTHAHMRLPSPGFTVGVALLGFISSVWFPANTLPITPPTTANSSMRPSSVACLD